MADDILFTGSADMSEINSALDGMIASAKRMEAEEQRLQKELAETEAQLSKNKVSLAALAEQYKNLNKNASDYGASSSKIGTEAAKLRKEIELLTNTVAKQKTELVTSQKVLADMKTKYEATGKAATEFVNKSGQDAVKVFGKISSAAEGVKSSVSNVTTSLSSGGGLIEAISSTASAFGVWGLVAGAAISFVGKGIINLRAEQEKIRQAALDEFNAAKELQKVNSWRKEAAEDIAKEAMKVELLVKQLQTEILTKKQRTEAINQLKEISPTYFGMLDKEKATIESITAAYQNYIDAIRTSIEIRVVEKQLTDVIDQRLDLENKGSKRQNEVVRDKDGKIIKSTNAIYNPNAASMSFQEQQRRQTEGTLTLFDDEYQKWKNLKFSEDLLLTKLVDLQKASNLNRNKKTKEILNPKSPENIYLQELTKLQNELSKFNEKQFKSEETITAALTAEFNKREQALKRAKAAGKLTLNELNDLTERLAVLETKVKAKALEDFQLEQRTFQNKIDDEISKVTLDVATKRVQLLQDQFERERKTIEAESEKTKETVIEKRDKLIKDIQDRSKKQDVGFDVNAEIQSINSKYNELLNVLEETKNKRLQKLAFDTFNKLNEEANKILLDSGNLGATQGAVIKIKEQTELYLKGEISYEKYQKKLTEIAKFEAKQRLEGEKLNAENLLRVYQSQLNQELTPEQRTTLEDKIRRQQLRIAELEKQLLISSTEESSGGFFKFNNETKNKLKELSEYANVISNLSQSVISFWAKANEAEQKALDKSIALQEKRVDSARRIADRGNAEYLRLEEDRLKELEVKRENAARRQLSVNAALQASQVITALIGGIAQGVATGGPLGALIGLTAVVSAIASGYAIAQSLKPQEPSFFVGTEDTGKGGNEDNKGGFKAILHPHERVLTAEENKKLKGISNKELIAMVDAHRYMINVNYPKNIQPQLSLKAMEMANNVSSTQNIKLAAIMEENNRKLEENNMLHRRTHYLLKNMGVNVNMDRNGIAVSVLEATEEIIKSKKS